MTAHVSTALVFLVYDSRSGSTLLAALLNRLAGVSVLPESRFVSGVLEYRGDLGSREALDAVLRHLDHETHFRELNVDRGALHARLAALPAPWTRRQLIDALLDTCFEQRNANACLRVIKSGRAIYHADTLLDLYPDAHFVHVVRDGRAVFASKRRSVATSGEMMETNVLKAARDWADRLARADRLGPAVVHVRYEDLLADPEPQVERICDVFGLATQARKRAKEQAEFAREIGPAQRHLHTRIQNAPDPARANAWRQSVAPWEVALYQQIAGRWLARHDYVLDDTGLGNAEVLLRRGWLWCALWLRRAARVARLARRPVTLGRRLQEKLYEHAE